MPQIIPVILCGGSGTRLWPLSRESYPKQFVDYGHGHSLFKDTLARVDDNIFTSPLVVCNEKYRFYALNEMRASARPASILLEPEGRNTAAAIALASELVLSEGGEIPLMLVLPSDHRLSDAREFVEIVKKAIPLAEEGHIVAFGIKPDSPATGFGYIGAGEKLGQGFRIKEFVEKPCKEKAVELLASGNHYWNAGIFLAKAEVFLAELQKYAPEIQEQCRLAWQNRKVEKFFIRPGKAEFLACPAESIDYAVMEKTDRAAMMPLDISWNDLGSWESFFQDAAKDADNNACFGDVMLSNVKNSYLRSGGRLVAAIGVSDIAVIETRDAVLVANRSDCQQVKEIVTRLKKAGRSESRDHCLVYRPWGSYETLALGDRFQVKRIIVNPGEILSLQMHHHRAEHWIIVQGTAEITNGDNSSLFSENQSTYIPIGCKHRLRNPGKIPLIMIEIQSGAYLGEDDIVRYEDVYGRNSQEDGNN